MAGLMGAVHCDSSTTYRQSLMTTTTRPVQVVEALDLPPMLEQASF